MRPGRCEVLLYIRNIAWSPEKCYLVHVRWCCKVMFGVRVKRKYSFHFFPASLIFILQYCFLKCISNGRMERIMKVIGEFASCIPKSPVSHSLQFAATQRTFLVSLKYSYFQSFFFYRFPLFCVIFSSSILYVCTLFCFSLNHFYFVILWVLTNEVYYLMG